MTIVLIVAGLLLLAFGGELLVRGAVNSARALGVSPLLIGLTVVGFGTSTPELVTSLFAAFQDAPGIVVGNVVGSNIANILLILGVVAVMTPLAARPGGLRRDGSVLTVATAACMVAVFHGELSRGIGAVFTASLVAYIAWAYQNERRRTAGTPAMRGRTAADAAPRRRRLGMALFITALGIGMTVLGARLLVDGAILLARSQGISETVIGLTVVALGTSLPELVAGVIAAYRGHVDMALGNVLGSCVYNLLGILGMTAMIHPITIPVEIARVDIWVLAAATALLLLFLRTRWMLSRAEGGLFLAGYTAYLAYLALHG